MRKLCDGKGQIYVLLDGDAFKIGFTKEAVCRRICLLQGGNPRPLKLFMAVPGTHAQEQAVHERIKKWKIRGEWFEIEALDYAIKYLPCKVVKEIVSET